MDLRLFASLLDDDESHDDEYDDMKEPLKQILLWMWNGRGVPDVPTFNVVCQQAIILADNMRKDVKDFYKYFRDSRTTCYRWHIKGNDGSIQLCSGAIIQQEVWTMTRLHGTSPALLWVYNHVLLKISNEVVIEGMCKWVSKNAYSIQGFSFGRYTIILKT